MPIFVYPVKKIQNISGPLWLRNTEGKTMKIDMLCGRGRDTPRANKCKATTDNSENNRAWKVAIIFLGRGWFVPRPYAAACAKRGFIMQIFCCTPTINYFRYWLNIGPIRKVVVIIADCDCRPRVTVDSNSPLNFPPRQDVLLSMTR